MINIRNNWNIKFRVDVTVYKFADLLRPQSIKAQSRKQIAMQCITNFEHTSKYVKATFFWRN